MTQKLFIPNRHNNKIAVVVDESSNAGGLAFVMHGLGGFKEQPTIQTIASAFKKNNFTVVSFDAIHTFGESQGGEYADATTTNYYEDLEDVILWAKTQQWFQTPFWLAGHSLGGISTALYAERHPSEVKGLAPISTVVSGKLSLEKYDPEILENYKSTGWREQPSASKPGLIKRIKWAEMEDRLRYDLLPEVSKLTMPVLMIVGENDTGTPYQHQKILFDVLPGEKEIHSIKNGPHTFVDPVHTTEIEIIFDNWIKKHL